MAPGWYLRSPCFFDIPFGLNPRTWATRRPVTFCYRALLWQHGTPHHLKRVSRQTACNQNEINLSALRHPDFWVGLYRPNVCTGHHFRYLRLSGWRHIHRDKTNTAGFLGDQLHKTRPISSDSKIDLPGHQGLPTRHKSGYGNILGIGNC